MEPTGETRNVRVVVFKRDGVPPPEPKSVMRLIQPADMENASLLTKAQRLRRELTAWAKAGMPLAPKETRQARLAVCASCEYYDPKGNLGMGACKAPGCGCSRVKAALATSKCPKGKWTA